MGAVDGVPSLHDREGQEVAVLRRSGGWLVGLVGLVLSGALAAAAPAMGATGDQSVAYQVDPAHDGWLQGVQYGTPLTRRWTDTFGDAVTFPLIADGADFVLGTPAASSQTSSLFSLNPATGATNWQHPLGGSGVGMAYDAGQVFVVDGDGLLTAFNAATGAISWSVQLPGQYSFSSAPTAVDGVVYAGGAGEGGTLYAVDETSGALRWSQSVENGDTSSPAVDATNVYVTYPGQYYAFNRSTGAPAWWDQGSIEGGGGWTPVVADGHVFARDTDTSSKILSAATGAVQGPLGSTTAPAVANGVAYELDGATLQAVPDDGLGATAWSFSGDGQLDTAPIVTGTTVWVGSSSGNLYALDGSTGQALWSTNVGAPINGPNDYSGPLRGLAVGQGNILVPAGSTLIDYSAPETVTGGGSPSPAPGAGTPQSPSPTKKATLLIEIAPRMTVRQVLARRSLRLAVLLPTSGRVLVQWFDTPRRHARRLLAASGRSTYRRAGRHVLVLHVTAGGRRALRGAHRSATLTGYASFAPARGRTIVFRSRFRLPR